jgi:hypothetical protein
MTESRTTSPFITEPRLVLEAIAPAPEAARAPQDLAKGLLLIRLSFTQELDGPSHQLSCGCPFTGRSLIEPGLVSLVE